VTYSIHSEQKKSNQKHAAKAKRWQAIRPVAIHNNLQEILTFHDIPTDFISS
jgi:hypothetical protein